MKNKESSITATQWFWVLLAIGLLTRIPLLHLASAETTDGVLCLTYFSPEFAQTPRFVILPGYPFLLWLGQEMGWTGWVWGRVVAALAGLFFLFPLWRLSRRWVSTDVAGWVCLAGLFSPLLWQWSLKVMPDTLFLLAFTWSLERLVTACLERDEGSWIAGNLMGAVAACVRPEGFLLLPWIMRWNKSSMGRNHCKRIAWFLIFWIGPFCFFAKKFWIILSAYREGMGMVKASVSPGFPLHNFLDHLRVYLFQPFWVMTPVVYGLAIFGLTRMIRAKDGLGRVFRGMILPVYGLILASRLIPVSYIDRHMLPLLPLVLAAAGVQMEWCLGFARRKLGPIGTLLFTRGLVFLFLGLPFLLSTAALTFQRDSMGDIKRSSEFLKTLPPHAVIYSDEIPKTQYWSGRTILPLGASFHPRKGDYLALHSCYTLGLESIDREIKRRAWAVSADLERSSLVPLLTDMMEDSRAQNRVIATSFRFKTQFFESRIYRIEK